MADDKEIGYVLGSFTEATFKWTISDFENLPLKEDISYKSPHFRLSDSSWYLSLRFGGVVSTTMNRRIGVFLHREDAGSSKFINFTLRIGCGHGIASAKFTGSGCFTRGLALGEPKLVYLIPMVPYKYYTYPLTVSCEMSCSESLLLQEKQLVSCAIQTGDLDSVIDKENFEDQDLSSLDTEEKLFVSCGIQTEVPDSVIDKENLEDEGLSSLDTKDVTLLTERMEELLIKGSDHDLKIVVKNKEFRAHRNILTARSPVFSMILTHDTKESNTGTISIEDCDPDSFDEFLLYVYSGRTENLTPSKALQLYYTADKYDFPMLKERCAILLKTSLSVESICDVVLLAARHGEKELLEAATEFFARNMREILVTVHWQEFLSKNPVEGNELYIKSMEVLVPRK